MLIKSKNEYLSRFQILIFYYSKNFKSITFKKIKKKQSSMEVRTKISPIETDENASNAGTNNKLLVIISDVIRVVVCRALAILIYSYSIGFMICALPYSYKFSFLVFLLPIIIIIMDTLWICIKRKRKEYDWFSISAFALSFIMGIFWYLSSFKGENKIKT